MSDTEATLVADEEEMAQAAPPTVTTNLEAPLLVQSPPPPPVESEAAEAEATTATAPTTTTSTEEEQERVFNKIVKLHFSAAIFFAAQTIAYIVAIPSNVQVISTTGFAKSTNGPIGEAAMQSYTNTAFNPCWLVVGFVGLAFLDHAITTLLCCKLPKLVKTWLFVHKNNPLRWMEYVVSASAMLVAIAILCGVHDQHLWYTMGFLNILGISTGQLLEELPRASRHDKVAADPMAKRLYLLGCVACLAPWIVILCYFFRASAEEDVPGFIYAAMLGTLVLFSTFALNSLLHHLVGLYDFHTAELVYVVLSFTAKTFLAADVFGGLRAAGS